MGYSTLLDPKSVRVLIGKKRKESVDSLWTVETWQNDLFKVLFNQNRGNPAIDCCAVLRQWPFSRLDKDYISSLIRKEDATIFKRKGILANVNIMKNFEERVPSFQRYFEENMIEKSCSLTPNECFNSLLQERIEFMTKKGIFSDYFKLLCVFVNTATRRPALDIAKLLVPVVSGIQLTNTQKSILTKLISNALLSGWFEAIDIIRSVFDFNEFDLLQAPHTPKLNPLLNISEKTDLEVIKYLAALCPVWMGISDQIKRVTDKQEHKVGFIKRWMGRAISRSGKKANPPKRNRNITNHLKGQDIIVHPSKVCPLDRALLMGNDDLIEFFVDNSPDEVFQTNRRIFNHDNLLVSALRSSGSVRVLHRLLEKYIDDEQIFLNTYYKSKECAGSTLLMLAIQRLANYGINNPQCQEYLQFLQKIFDKTPLHMVQFLGYLERNSAMACFGWFSSIPTFVLNLPLFHQIFNSLREILPDNNHFKSICRFEEHLCENPALLGFLYDKGLDWADFITLKYPPDACPYDQQIIYLRREAFRKNFNDFAIELIVDAMVKQLYCFDDSDSDDSICSGNSMQDTLVSFDFSVRSVSQWYIPLRPSITTLWEDYS
eukprot:TRINITY_DN2441_c0_g1_i4.p1 TRINITY_DN2441_c0_g1~~TRINITY_DN2441_c0_g1_i4.p1  ORF type:complete len:603 (+),score=83.61 TRINITY_DN2441_c0_g1_i4:144-1952(+)